MSPQEQADMVRAGKKFENGFINDPVCLTPQNLVGDVLELKARHGFCGIPVTDTGKLKGKLLGIVTARDIQWCPPSATLQSVMTTDIVTGKQGMTLEEANKILRNSKKGKLPVVDA